MSDEPLERLLDAYRTFDAEDPDELREALARRRAGIDASGDTLRSRIEHARAAELPAPTETVSGSPA